RAALRAESSGAPAGPGKAARAGVVTCWIGALERDSVPASLRVETPAKMRDRMLVHVVQPRLIALEPITHQLGIETALDAADKSVADVEPDLVLHIAAIGQNHDIARQEHDRAAG